ncbi:cytosolic sulfotransferase 12-like [Prosopis cineraria]|uniref:cytosolic sulfotransferase 12-like n=1 Tax=Prosopis cineraria TaxID=364024 RepID=UPI00240F7C1D|nr:cytosolic sulfotransferase 12-like [Prosopis cineraria]
MAAQKSNASVLFLQEDDDESLSQECRDLIATLPSEPNRLMTRLYQFKGFWVSKKLMQAVLNCQNHFQAHDSDVLLVTLPKSGTTLLKALAFAIINRKAHSQQHHQGFLEPIYHMFFARICEAIEM